MRRFVPIVVAMLVASSLQAASGQTSENGRTEAFGLKFGDTFAQAKAKGLVGKLDEQSGPITQYDVSKLPNSPSMTDVVQVAFVEGAGLQQIHWTSTTVRDDPFGTSGKKLYDSIKATLLAKYGVPDSEFHKVGIELYKDSDEFYECLDYSGCGMWATIWNGSYGAVLLTIESGGSRGTGWIDLVYEGPKWNAAVDAMKAKTKAKDHNAF